MALRPLPGEHLQAFTARARVALAGMPPVAMGHRIMDLWEERVLDDAPIDEHPAKRVEAPAKAKPRGRGLGRNVLVEYADEHDGQLPDISDAKLEKALRNARNTFYAMTPDTRNYQEAERRVKVLRRARLLRLQGVKKDILERQEHAEGKWEEGMALIQEGEAKRRSGMEMLRESHAASGQLVASAADAADRALAAAMASNMLQLAAPGGSV
jgi:hypothetical protein